MRLLSARWPARGRTPGPRDAGHGIRRLAGAITPSVTEYTAGMPAGSEPHGMALGDDGNVWFADHGIPTAEAIGFITPAGSITRYTAGISNSVGVEDVAQGPGGIWFSELNAKQIGVVTPGGAVTEFGGLFEKPGRHHRRPRRRGLVHREQRAATPSARITVAARRHRVQRPAMSGGPTRRTSSPAPTATSGSPSRAASRSAASRPSASSPSTAPASPATRRRSPPAPTATCGSPRQSPAAIGRITPLGAVTDVHRRPPRRQRAAGDHQGLGRQPLLHRQRRERHRPGHAEPARSPSSARASPRPPTSRASPPGSDGALWFAEHIGAIGRMTVGPTAKAAVVQSVDQTSATLKANVTTGGARGDVRLRVRHHPRLRPHGAAAIPGDSDKVDGHAHRPAAGHDLPRARRRDDGHRHRAGSRTSPSPRCPPTRLAAVGAAGCHAAGADRGRERRARLGGRQRHPVAASRHSAPPSSAASPPAPSRHRPGHRQAPRKLGRSARREERVGHRRPQGQGHHRQRARRQGPHAEGDLLGRPLQRPPAARRSRDGRAAPAGHAAGLRLPTARAAASARGPSALGQGPRRPLPHRSATAASRRFAAPSGSSRRPAPGPSPASSRAPSRSGTAACASGSCSRPASAAPGTSPAPRAERPSLRYPGRDSNPHGPKAKGF